MTFLGRLFSRILLRPGPSLLVLGAAILASNWLWYGSGLILGWLAGLALTIAGLAGFGYAAYALNRGRCQLQAMTLFIVAAVGLPAVALIALRWFTGAPLLMHDGAYQTEEAIKLVLAGHDPYGVDYSQTSMRLWHWYVNQPLDSSLFHYVYSPLTFLVGVPFSLAARVLGIPFDFRIVLIVAAVIAAAGLLRLPWRWELRYVALAALFLNPFFYFPQGRNDVLFLAPLTLGVLAWARGKPRLAALAFGVAFAFKPFALFYLPCVAVAIWPRTGPLVDRARRLAIIGAALLAPAAITMGPFLIWNAHAYWTDTVSFVAGTIPGVYRIQGYSLASLLLALHVIPSADARFPFGLVQAAVAAPVLAIGLRRIWRAPSLEAVLTVGTLALALSLVVGRFVNDNYLADLLYLAVLTGAARLASGGAIESSRTMPAAA
jgi:Glycosyltransferase family 87